MQKGDLKRIFFHNAIGERLFAHADKIASSGYTMINSYLMLKNCIESNNGIHFNADKLLGFRLIN